MQIPRRIGSLQNFNISQLQSSLERIKAASSPALHALYSSGMFAKERQFEPNQASYVARSTLVILPPSILHQWEKELQAWAPFLDVFVFQGSDVHKNTDIALARLMTCDVVLISCTAALVSFISKLLLDVFAVQLCSYSSSICREFPRQRVLSHWAQQRAKIGCIPHLQPVAHFSNLFLAPHLGRNAIH